MSTPERDRDGVGRARNARLRDSLGRPLPRGAEGYPPYDAPALPPADTLALAQQLLDEGRPFTAHEVLEARWKSAQPAERDFWQGLAQLAVGITHARRGNLAGAGRLLSRGAERLRPYAGTRPHGVDVDGLLQWASSGAALEAVAPVPRLVEESGGAGSGSGSIGE